MPTLETDALIRSALTTDNPFNSTAEVLRWLANKRASTRCRVQRQDLHALTGWQIEKETQNIVHQSGAFFSIEGLRVTTNWGIVPSWDQPIICQPEVGLLGILCCEVGGVYYFLLQAKTEPGNINGPQLAPTLQATKSNYSRVHKGKEPAYLEYFLDPGRHVLLDQLQSEQGSRFFQKRNRNTIVRVPRAVPVHENFIWVTLAQIQQLLRHDHVINMDTRTVISCLSFADPARDGVHNRHGYDSVVDPSPSDPSSSLPAWLDSQRHLHTLEELISWVTEQKTRHTLAVERIPLADVRKWQYVDGAWQHELQKYFTVIGIDVEQPGREVEQWSQPILHPSQEGLCVFLIRLIHGVYHFLVHAKLEAGNFDIIELAPTVQCVNDNYRESIPEQKPVYLDYVLSADPGQAIYDTLQSEEGGRFYREQNRNLIIEVDENFPMDVDDDYSWMTLTQIKTFIQFNNYFNVQARGLIAAVDLRPAS